MPLRMRVTLLVWATSLLVVIGTLVTVYSLLVSDYENLVAEREQAEISRLASALKQSLQQRVMVLESFVPRMLQDGQLRSLDQLEALLQQVSVAKDLFPDGLIVFDTAGTAIAESEFVSGRIGTNYADRAHFQRYFDAPGPLVSEPILGRTTGLPLLAFLVPIVTSTGQPMGILGGVLDLSTTPLALGEAEPSSEHLVSMVIDPHNRLYVELQQKMSVPIPLPAPGEHALVDAAEALDPTGSVIDHEGEPYLIATSRLPEFGWVMLRAMPYQEVTAPVRQSFARLLLISVAIASVMALIGWFVANSMTTPLVRMTQRVEKMANQEYSHREISLTGGPEVRALAAAMNRLTEERRRVDQMKNDFVSTVSHELRTPLTAIHGSLRLLGSGASGVLSEPAKQMVTMASRNSDRLLALIQDLLDFNKLMAGEVKLILQPCQLDLVISQAVCAIQPLADSKSLSFLQSDSLVATAWADESRLRQILDNLLSNAVKHSPEQGQIAIEIAEAGADFWRVTVSDQGDGVPESFRKRIFERFAQADQGSDRATTGTGLGLAISRALVHEMQGDIGYYNRRGAHFWFELPRLNGGTCHESVRNTGQ